MSTPHERLEGTKAAIPHSSSSGEGTRTLTPPKETPDFKSGAYDQFRHPGAARIAPARQRLEARRAPVVLRRDLLRRLAVGDHVLIVVVQNDVVRIAGEGLAVHVELERLPGSRAVAADAALGEPYAPSADELAKRERAFLRRLQVHDPGAVVGVELDEEAPLRRVAVGVDPDERRHRYVLAVDEDVQVLVDVERRPRRAERAQRGRREAIRQRAVLGRP